MPKLPEYRSKNILPPQDQAAFNRVSTTLRSEQSVAGALGRAGEAIIQADIAKNNLQTQNFLTQQTTSMKRKFDEVESDLRQRFSSNPDGIFEPLEREKELFVQDSFKGAPNERAKERWSQVSNAMYADIEARNRSWSDQQLVKNTEVIVSDAIQEESREVYRSADPTRLEIAFDAIDEIVQPLTTTMAPEMAEEYKKAARENATTQMFQGLLDRNKPWQADKLLKSKEFDKDLSAEGISRIRRAIDSRKKALTAKKKDYSMMKIENPHKYLKEIGVRFSPVNLGNSDSVMKRFEELDQAANKHNVNRKFLTVLTPLERASFNKSLSKANPIEAAATFWQMKKLPEKEFNSLARELSVGDPMAGLVMKLAQEGGVENEQKAVKILEGRKLIEKSVYDKTSPMRMPPQKNMEQALDNVMHNIDLGPLATRGLKESAMAMFALERRKKSNNSDKWEDSDDQKLMKKSFEKVAGEPWTWRGDRFLAPMGSQGKKLSPERVSYLLKNMNNNVLEKTHGSKVYDGVGVFDIEDNTSRLRPMKAPGGDGWHLTLDKGGEAGAVFLFDKNKKPYVLDFKKLDGGIDQGLVDTTGNLFIRAMRYLMDGTSDPKDKLRVKPGKEN